MSGQNVSSSTLKLNTDYDRVLGNQLIISIGNTEFMLYGNTATNIGDVQLNLRQDALALTTNYKIAGI